MVEKLSSYRVTAALDANAYAAGMAQKVAADKAGAASAAQVSFAINETQKKVNQSGDVLTRLSRSYIDGFNQAERFARAVATLGRGVETGNVSMSQAEMILEGIYRKYGQVANATDLAEQGHYQLAAAVTAVNARLAAEEAALDGNSLAHQRNAAAMRLGAQQRTNLMFQLQDIGVSLAGGMNPLMVMTQQLPQIAMIWGAGEGGLGRAFSETGKMAAGMVAKFWPIGAAIGAVATIFAAFTTEINRGQKQQVGFFDVIVAGWELVSEAIGRAIEPVVSWFGWLWDQASPIITDIGVLLIKTFDLGARQIGVLFQSIPAVIGDAMVSTAQAAVHAVRWMINTAIDALNWLTSGARELIKLANPDWVIGDITHVAPRTLDNPWKGTIGDLDAKMRAELEAVNNTDYLGALGDRARDVATRPSAKEAEKAAKKAAEEAERQRKAYADLTLSSRQFIAEKDLEARTLGMTTEAAARLRYEQELLNKAANDNIALSPTQRAELAQLAAEMAAAEERTRQLSEAYEFGKSTLGSFFSDFKTELMNGASLWGAFAAAGANALQTIADKALEMAANGFWDMIFGSVMSGLTGGGATGGAWNGGLWGSAIFNAKGNVFPSGVSGYSNQIVDRPTVFPFARGIGLMGEACPEAIMPLRRGPDGRLGVAAANSNWPSAGNDNAGWSGDMHITVSANSEEEGAAAARGFAREMRRWRESGEGAAFVRNVVNNPGRANPK